MKGHEFLHEEVAGWGIQGGESPLMLRSETGRQTLQIGSDISDIIREVQFWCTHQNCYPMRTFLELLTLFL